MFKVDRPYTHTTDRYAAAKSSRIISMKSYIFGKRFEGEVLIRTLSETLLEIFSKIIVNF